MSENHQTSSSSFDTSSSQPESRIGYDTLQLANQANQAIGSSGIGAQFLDSASSNIGSGYLDYLDYDTNNNNNFGLNNLNMYVNTMGGYANRNNGGRLRRRNGLLGQQGSLRGVGLAGQQAGLGGQSMNTASQNYLGLTGSGLGGAGLSGKQAGLGAGQGMNAADTQNYLGLTGSGLGGAGYAGLTGLGGVGLSAFGNGIGRQGYGHSGSGYGGGPVSFVSGYGPSQSCESGINPLLALLTLAGAAVGFYFIYIKLINAGGRKFGSYSFLQSFEEIADKIWIGKHLVLLFFFYISNKQNTVKDTKLKSRSLIFYYFIVLSYFKDAQLYLIFEK